MALKVIGKDRVDPILLIHAVGAEEIPGVVVLKIRPARQITFGFARDLAKGVIARALRDDERITPADALRLDHGDLLPQGIVLINRNLGFIYAVNVRDDLPLLGDFA